MHVCCLLLHTKSLGTSLHIRVPDENDRNFLERQKSVSCIDQKFLEPYVFIFCHRECRCPRCTESETVHQASRRIPGSARQRNSRKNARVFCGTFLLKDTCHDKSTDSLSMTTINILPCSYFHQVTKRTELDCKPRVCLPYGNIWSPQTSTASTHFQAIFSQCSQSAPAMNQPTTLY